MKWGSAVDLSSKLRAYWKTNFYNQGWLLIWNYANLANLRSNVSQERKAEPIGTGAVRQIFGENLSENQLELENVEKSGNKFVIYHDLLESALNFACKNIKTNKNRNKKPYILNA